MKKQIISIILVVCMVLSMTPMSLIESAAAELNSTIAQLRADSSQDKTVPNGLEYSIGNDAVMITDYKGSASELIIPKEAERNREE